MVSRKYHLLLSFSGALVSIDQLTKFSASANLREGESLSLGVPFFQLTLIKNHGAIFGIFSDLSPHLRDPIFLFVPMLTLLLIIAFYFKLSERLPFAIFSFCLIIGGALGNLLDRLRLGYVVDFLDFHWRQQYHFPAFNVADLSISIGVLLLGWAIFFERESLTEDGAMDD